MTHEEILSKIISIMRKIASDADLAVESNTRFDEIDDWDSLNTVDMEMEVEKAFSIDFEVGEFRELESVGVLVEYVANKIQ